MMAQTVSLRITAPRWGSRVTSGTKGRGGVRRADGAAETHTQGKTETTGARGLRRSGQHDRLRVRIRRVSTLRAESPMASQPLSMKAKVLPSPRALLHPSPYSIRAPCSALHRPRTPRPGPSSFPKRRLSQRLHRACALTASSGCSDSIFPEAGLDAPRMKQSPLAPRPCPPTQMTFLLLSHPQLPSHVSCAYCTRPRAEDPGLPAQRPAAVAGLLKQPLVLTLLPVCLCLQPLLLRPHSGQLLLEMLQAGGLPGEGLTQLLVLLLFICTHREETPFAFLNLVTQMQRSSRSAPRTRRREGGSSGICDCGIPIISCVLGR